MVVPMLSGVSFVAHKHLSLQSHARQDMYTLVNLFLRFIRQFSRVWSRLSFCKVSVGLHEGTAVAPRALPSAFRVHEGVFGCMYICVSVYGWVGLSWIARVAGWMARRACLCVRRAFLHISGSVRS